MNHLFSRRAVQLLAAVSLTNFILPGIEAESLCPGSAAGVTPRLVRHALIVIPVRVNQAGPFDFMVDTGSQVTVIDPSLASELNLRSQGGVRLVTVASSAQASVTMLDALQADSQVVEKTPAVVQDLRQIQAADPRIRGVLGESFLSHFDLLIDYSHKLVCLDETSSMRAKVQGEHIPLVGPQHPEDELPFMERLVISVRLSGVGAQPTLLQLDSGSDGPILYPGSKEQELEKLAHAIRRESDLSNAQRALAALPVQDVRIGSRTLRNVSFVTPVSPGVKLPRRSEDGLLPTLLFQRVFISSADHYLILDPR